MDNLLDRRMEASTQSHPHLGSVLEFHHRTGKVAAHSAACQAQVLAVLELEEQVLEAVLEGEELVQELVAAGLVHQMAIHICHCSISYQSHIQTHLHMTDHRRGSTCHRQDWPSTYHQANLWDTQHLRSHSQLSKSLHHLQPVSDTHPLCKGGHRSDPCQLGLVV